MLTTSASCNVIRFCNSNLDNWNKTNGSNSYPFWIYYWKISDEVLCNGDLIVNFYCPEPMPYLKLPENEILDGNFRFIFSGYIV